VSHPDMLGDGSCDGGNYNTKACNYDGGDCCKSTCRPALHRCGDGAGYQCVGERTGVQVGSDFKCDRSKVSAFTYFFEQLRDEITIGDAMQTSAQCSHLTKEEHANVAQAYNIGILLGYYPQTQSAAARRGGPDFFVECALWDKEIGSVWFGTLVSHEMGHVAGYGHPAYSQQTYTSECENIGSDYCGGHCKEWTRACENHAVFGSSSCGFAGFGCKTTCVHRDYCFSLPERVTECFGYEKVHSRGESALARAEKATGWSVWSAFEDGGSSRQSLSAPSSANTI